jgi:predicted peptidase
MAELQLPSLTLIMRKTIAILAIASTTAATGAICAQETDPELMQQRLEFTGKVTKSVNLGYLLFLPKDYLAKARKQWPLMLFLHGAGERGTNLSMVSMHGPPKLVKKSPPVPQNESDEARQVREQATKLLVENFIVVSPQCPAGQRWENDALLALLDKLITKHRVDTNRVYLTGLSMGGYGSWSLGIRNAERFAAMAPICGGGELIDILLASRAKESKIKSLPVWAFHGAKDPVVPLTESERMVNALKKVGSKEADLTVYPEAQHDSWTATYNNPKLYEWFLQHERR